MNLLTIFLSLLIAVNADSDQEKWISFKSKHDKSYRSLREESERFNIFQDNLRKIESHNAKYELGETLYKMGVTKFADLTQDEFVQKFSMPEFNPGQPEAIFRAKPVIHAEGIVNWKRKGAVLDVENQLECGCCWAFSTVGALEGQNIIKHKRKILLSPQELVDCSQDYGTKGCHGGWMYNAFQYVQDHGISSLQDYQYHGDEESCKNSTTSRAELNVTGYTLIEPNEEALRQAVETVGPISVTLFSGFLGLYDVGIFDECPQQKPTHAVLAVGYGVSNGTDYWFLKNSWGKNWGEHGYFKLIRNWNNACGIASHAMYPNVS